MKKLISILLALVQEATGTADFSYTDNFANVCTVAIDQTYALVAVAPDGNYKQYNRGWSDLEGMLADACKEVVDSAEFAETLAKYHAQPYWRDAAMVLYY